VCTRAGVIAFGSGRVGLVFDVDIAMTIPESILENAALALSKTSEFMPGSTTPKKGDVLLLMGVVIGEAENFPAVNIRFGKHSSTWINVHECADRTMAWFRPDPVQQRLAEIEIQIKMLEREKMKLGGAG